jgi:endonuclease/exonuclease/phosphatase family metal-dependent hydrolase
MPFYNDLRPDNDAKKQEFGLLFDPAEFDDKQRLQTIDSLLKIRKELKQRVPEKSADKSLLLASWNIKEFGHLKERLPESYFYIAEVISRFDLIAVQEIKRELDDLNRVLKILGSDWKYIITDITEGRAGNRERFAYIYDSRKVEPSGLSGEIVLWDDLTKDSDLKQLKRTPAITGFTAGWKSFAIINVHFHPGNSSQDKKVRNEEITLLLKALKEKERKGHLWNDNLIILGDMNLFMNNSDMVEQFVNNGYIESEGLIGKPTNIAKNKEIYDRIFYKANNFFKVIEDDGGRHRADVLEVFDFIYPDSEFKRYEAFMKIHKDDPSNIQDDPSLLAYYQRFWRKGQISDHNPIWVELEIDSSDDFLEKRRDMF